MEATRVELEATRVELHGLVRRTDEIRTALREPDTRKQECENLKNQLGTLRELLLSAARTGGLYERPTRRIMLGVEKSLEKALALAKKCKKSGFVRVIIMASATDFKRATIMIDSSIGDLRWLLSVSASGDERSEYAGLPPVVATDPILALIWEQVASVQSGTAEAKADGAAYLASLARDNDRNGKMIIEEGGLPPLLKLLRDGTAIGQENAGRALGVLARDEQRVQEMIKEGAIPVFLHVLNDGQMKVQIEVAWALAHMASHSRDAQNSFASNGAIRLLVALLAHDTVEEPSKNNKVSMHTVVTSSLAKKGVGGRDAYSLKPSDHEVVGETGLNHGLNHEVPDGFKVSPQRVDAPVKPSGVADVKSAFSRPGSGGGGTLWGAGENGRVGHLRQASRKDRDKEDPEVKAKLKAEVAHALWMMAKGNVNNCKSITDTRALLCFAKLIEQGDGEVQMNSVMAVMEIAIAAEIDPDLKRAAFKTNSPAAKAIVQQLLRVIQEGEADLQVPCLKSIGCLARIFPAATNVIQPLAAQLSNRDYPSVAAAAAAALTKFVDKDNYLKVEHSKSIIVSSGVSPIVQLASFGGDPEAQFYALKLLCYLAIHVGDSESLDKALPALLVSRDGKLLDSSMKTLISDAIQRLELSQAGTRKHDMHGYH